MNTRILNDSDTVIVKPDVAVAQMDAERAKRDESVADPGTWPDTLRDGGATATDQPPIGKRPASEPPAPPPKLGRFHGTVSLDAIRLGRDASKVAEEIVQHLAGIVGADVEITLEIEAKLPDGATDKLVRDITKNCRTLKFTNYGFEEH